MSPSPAAPSTASIKRMGHDIGVRVPGESPLARELDAREHQPAA